MCVQGDDYVIYCHPSKQKNPRASHLREWYHTLLDEAVRRGIVTFRSSLYDSFFEGGKEHALTEVSSQKLPYFDGDFWPGEAETRLNEISSGKAPASAFSRTCLWCSWLVQAARGHPCPGVRAGRCQKAHSLRAQIP
jgi:hypothetical protein